jgi:hypothetical protein
MAVTPSAYDTGPLLEIETENFELSLHSLVTSTTTFVDDVRRLWGSTFPPES